MVTAEASRECWDMGAKPAADERGPWMGPLSVDDAVNDDAAMLASADPSERALVIAN